MGGVGEGVGGGAGDREVSLKEEGAFAEFW